MEMVVLLVPLWLEAGHTSLSGDCDFFLERLVRVLVFEWGRWRCAQVAEWLMAADCKSATLRVTEVRILPCAPFTSLVCRRSKVWTSARPAPDVWL